MTSLIGIGNGGYYRNLIQQSLFNEIDTSGSGSINKSELEQAVTTAGGTTAAADALYAQLDPNNTGSVSEQQFSQNLPPLPFSDGMGAQMIGFQANGWPGAPDPAQVAQSLYSEIDTSGSGSFTKSDLEAAVTKAGGTTAAADALYAKLDPNNTGSVSEQQFVTALSQGHPHHHHFHAVNDGGSSAQDALAALLGGATDGTDPTNAATSPSQLAQTLFSQIDATGTGSITKSELETAVTQAGGTTAAADALYAQLDPNNTGSVSEPQFAQFLQPSSPSGNTARDALLALINSANSQSASAAATASSSSDGSTGATTGVTAASGNTAQDALWALMGNLGTDGSGSNVAGAPGASAQDALLALLNGNLAASQDPLLSLTSDGSNGSFFDPSGTSAQDALLALMQASGNTLSNRSPSSRNGSGLDMASVIALYQSQLSQQALGAAFNPTATS